MAAPWVGIKECLQHSIAGGTYVAADNVQSGTLGSDGGEPQYSEGAGGQAVVWRGMVTPTATIKCDLQSWGLLGCAMPTALGNLPPSIAQLIGGPVGEANAARLLQSCYLTSTKISCEHNGVVQVEHSLLALSRTKATISSAVAKQTGTPFPSHAMSVLINSAAHVTQSWEVEITTGVVAKGSLDAKVAGVQRMPEFAEIGTFQVKFNASVRVPIVQANDFVADYPDDITVAITGVNSDVTPKTLSIGLTGGDGMHTQDDPLEIVKGSEEVVYKISAESTPNDLSVITLSLA